MTRLVMLSQRHRETLLIGILVLCLAGAWMSGQLLKMHDRGGSADAGDPGLLTRLCRSVSGGESDCEATIGSAWSRISLPVPLFGRGLTPSLRWFQLPVAFLGLSYFVSLGTWFVLIGGRRPIGAGRHRLVLAVAICGVGASAFLVGLMAFGGAPWCVGCLAVHVLNLLLVAAIWVLVVAADAARIEGSDRPSAPARLTAREAGTAILFASVLVAGLFLYRQESLVHRYEVRQLEPYKDMVLSLQRDPELLIKSYVAQPQRRLEARRGEVVATGQHQLVVFTDFECDACYLNSHVIRDEVQKAFGGKLAVWVRHFPLCAHCNPGIKKTVHPNACRAAYAAEVVRLQRGPLAFELAHGLLFANRKQLSDGIYRYVAAQVALKPEAFLKEMEAPAIRRLVEDDIALGRELGVDGTPTMFLDGRRIPAWCLTPEFWQAAARLPAPTVACGHSAGAGRGSGRPPGGPFKPACGPHHYPLIGWDLL
jgi:protein-disulfide isomerase